MARRIRLQKWEEREQLYDARPLFDFAERFVTSELVEYYRKLKSENGWDAWVMGVERQSLGVLAHGDPNHTGHIGRVQKILEVARQKQFNIDVPILIPDRERKKGQPPFIFDERCWFVDGEDDPSTGHSLDPQVRPRLWTLFAILRRLNQVAPDARPRAILIADELRFMRASHALAEWYRGLAAEGVGIYFPDSGWLAPEKLELVTMKMRVMSEHLPDYRKSAMEVARSQERILWVKQPKYGILYEDDGRTVVADPIRWVIMSETIHKLASGELASLRKAVVYVRQTYGDEQKVSIALISDWLKAGSIAEGVSQHYTRKFDVCMIKEKYGPGIDYNFTSSRKRRYITEEEPKERWVSKTIEHRHGTESISQAVLLQARMRVQHPGRRPNTENIGEGVWRVVPPGLIRCVHCKKMCFERPPYVPKDPNKKVNVFWKENWTVSCTIIGQLIAQGLTRAEARTHVHAQHKKMARGSLSLALIPLLRERLFDQSLDLEEFIEIESKEYHAEHDRLQKERDDLARRLEIQMLTLEEYHPVTARVQHLACRGRIDQIAVELQKVDDALNQICSRHLADAAGNSALQQAHDAYQELIARFGHTPDFWRTVVATFVKEIWLDPETGHFTVDCVIDCEQLSGIAGELSHDGVHGLLAGRTTCEQFMLPNSCIIRRRMAGVLCVAA